MDNGTSFESASSGSRWHRWDPHIHGPGTVLNDQFKGDTIWDDYLKLLESSSPPIRAIGITDYYSTETYENVCEFKKAGRLSNCDLIFPNIEMRLGIATSKGRWVNIHLIVSPEDDNHIAIIKSSLARLTFDALGESFSCTKEDLIRLGRKLDSKLNDKSALALGSEQFKVSLDQLRQLYKSSQWIEQNVLIAVSGSESDGSSGVREGADMTLRYEIEKFAHIIFSSNEAQREFWLGRGKVNETEIRQRFGGLKPCLHGSDAHALSTVGTPQGDRYSWVKGAISFDSLRQACIDPRGRAYVGCEPPNNAPLSQIIERIEVNNAKWAVTKSIEINPGLVAIIGARGSGKTALADIIALGCDSTSNLQSSASFLTRAQDLLQSASVRLKWFTGDVTERRLDRSDAFDSAEYPRARYLSQQFVDELCSSHGMTDGLLREIERVIFESHPLSDRDGAVNFEELLLFNAGIFRDARIREEKVLGEIAERISSDQDKVRLVPTLRKQVAEKNAIIERYISDRQLLVVKGSETRVQRLTELNDAAEIVRSYIRFFANQELSILKLKDEVRNFRTHQAPENLRMIREQHKASGFRTEEWNSFLLDYTGDVDSLIETYLSSTQRSKANWKGSPPPPNTNSNSAFVADDADLKSLPLSLLEAEIKRIEEVVSIDMATANKYALLSKKINEETNTLNRLNERLQDCEEANKRIMSLSDQRHISYKKVFEAIVAEENVLRTLYMPLLTRLEGSTSTLGKLSFSVSREANIAHWAAEGEKFLDLRIQGPFKGRGKLRQIAEVALKSAWECGDPETISNAMDEFIKNYRDDFLEHSPVPKEEQANYREWAKKLSKWLFGTNHITIHYSIDYDGTDIRKLSPGTRGIVLLLIYLALDEGDDRPLIIDQPEENLDPKSIFDELVQLFLSAKQKRQVILVTHNANLVVNTDADQVIVASVGPHQPGELPPISYITGGLENSHIRKAVCDILEGGSRAFQERARRLRVQLER